MPIAIFQCDSFETSTDVKNRIRRFCNGVSGLDYWTMGGLNRLLMVSFKGDCDWMYRFCMTMVSTTYLGRAVLIGIDETRESPHDEYKLCTIDTMPYNVNMRDLYHQSAFRKLINDFVPAIQGSKFNWNECLTIAERCVLGADQNDSIDFCTQITMMMSNTHHSRKYIEEFFATLSPSAWAFDCSFTFGRVMAHWCYLRLAKFKER